MRAIVLKGVNINNTSAPVIDIDPERRAVASIPGLITVVEPNEQNIDAAGARAFDMQDASWWSGPTSIQDTVFTKLNGVDALDATQIHGSFTSDSIKYNASEGTLFAVVKLPDAKGAATIFGTRTGDAIDGGIHMGMTNSGYLCWYVSTADNGTPSVGYDGTDHTGETLLIMATYNSESGRKIFANGEQVVDTGTDESRYLGNLTNTDISIFAKNTNSTPLTGQNGAVIGHFGILDIDLSKPIYSKRKKVLENWLMDMYGLK